MAYRRPAAVDASAIIRNPAQHEDWIRDVHERLGKLEKRNSIEAVSSQQRSPIAEKPPRAGVRFTGAPGKGRWQLFVRNPEFGNTAGTGKHTPTPLYHRVSYSADPTFRTGVTQLDPSPQTHFPIVDEPNQVLHIKIESSRDGINWNLPQYVQAQG